MQCVCVYVCTRLHVAGWRIPITALCQLIRDERDHLFRGAGRRVAGWLLRMGGCAWNW